MTTKGRNQGLKLPELQVKSNYQKVESQETNQYIIKESNSAFASANEEINNIEVKLYKSENSKIISSVNSSGNETTARTHKQSNVVPVLKQREKKNENNINPNIKRVQKSTFQKKIRYDKNGVEINHKNKKNVKISFRDQIDELQDFCDIIEVESIKEYIKVYGKVDRKDTYVRDTICSSCSCFIF
jgi:hypothetical protein